MGPTRGLLLLAPLLLAACQSDSSYEPEPEETVEVDRDALNAVLELEDWRVGEPIHWEPLLGHSQQVVRSYAAIAAGRTRDGRLAPLLRSRLETEPRDSIRARLAFALGLLDERPSQSTEVLSGLLEHPADLIRIQAAGALGRLNDPAGTAALIECLADPTPEVRSAAILALVRLRGRRVKPPRPLEGERADAVRTKLAALMEDDDPDVQWRAVYGLANLVLPDRLPLLEKALASRDMRSRLFAVRGIGRLGEDPAPRRALVSKVLSGESSPHVAAAAARVLGELKDPASIDLLLEVAKRNQSPADHHPRRAAVQALVALAGPDLEDAVRGRILALLEATKEDSAHGVRVAAFLGRAKLDPDVGLALIQDGAASKSSDLRTLAAEAAVHVGAATEHLAKVWALLQKLALDAEPRVASAALTSLAELGEIPNEERRTLALQVLEDSEDVAVRATALTLLGKVGQADDLGTVLLVWWRSEGAGYAEARLEALAAAAALAKDRALAFLESGLDDPSPAVRRAAARSIEKLTGEPPIPSTQAPRVRSSVEIVLGRDLETDRPNPRVTLHTSRGQVVIELLRKEAPRHARMFLEQTRAGTYDNLRFHRVVSAFVVQGLDPRGDGWGTGGVFLRDEINEVPYLRGAVGMPNAGPDSGGCQIFITHIPTPHLDGGYTVFGQVVEGMDVVDAIDVDDRCERVEIIRD